MSVRSPGHDALALFDAVVELEGIAREARLADADPLAAELVRRWLAADGVDDPRLRAGHYEALALELGAIAAGAIVGPYRLVREIGRGGMGVVWLAERADGGFDQRVALKLMRATLDAESAERRFRRERQILASLEHPHIARLLDGGATAEGRPYFVMEYIEGLPLPEWCVRRGRNVRERLGIFVDVCAAVEYAHRNRVVHRDIKPANVLVTADGSAKLLDFGIAKLIVPELFGA